jgi:hypothetical protein
MKTITASSPLHPHSIILTRVLGQISGLPYSYNSLRALDYILNRMRKGDPLTHIELILLKRKCALNQIPMFYSALQNDHLVKIFGKNSIIEYELTNKGNMFIGYRLDFWWSLIKSPASLLAWLLRTILSIK